MRSLTSRNFAKLEYEESYRTKQLKQRPLTATAINGIEAFKLFQKKREEEELSDSDDNGSTRRSSGSEENWSEDETESYDDSASIQSAGRSGDSATTRVSEKIASPPETMGKYQSVVRSYSEVWSRPGHPKTDDGRKKASPAAWCWQDGDGQWVLYQDRLSRRIEELPLGGRYKFRTVSDISYEVVRKDIDRASQRNLTTGVWRRVKHASALGRGDRLLERSKRYSQKARAKSLSWYYKARDKHWYLVDQRICSLLNRLDIGCAMRDEIHGRAVQLFRFSELFAEQTYMDTRERIQLKADTNEKGQREEEAEEGEEEEHEVDEDEEDEDLGKHKTPFLQEKIGAENVRILFRQSESARKYQISSVETIMNNPLSGVYEALVKAKNIERSDQKWLWFGCSQSDCYQILNTGFDHSYAFDGNHGKGIYFFKNAKDARKFNNEKDRNGFRYLLLCRVIIRDRTSRQDDRIIHREPRNSTVYVVDRDYHALPEYIVKFKRKGL